MELSITTSGFLVSKDKRESIDLIDALKKAYKAGFKCIDIGWSRHNDKNFVLARDDWEKKVDEIGEFASQNGIEFYQSHTPFIDHCCMDYDPHFTDPAYINYYREMFRRSVLASAKLGVKWQVVHPNTYPEVNFERKASLQLNREFYDEFVELGIKLGVGTAYENMLPFLLREHPYRYCQHYEDLIDLVDSYNDEHVGICFDTGHANQGDFEIGRALRSCGNRVKALHISDNKYGTVDEHLAPFLGTIDWNAFAEALIDIDYKGTLNFETHKMLYDAPSGAPQDALGKFVYNNGKVLLSMYNDALKKRK